MIGLVLPKLPVLIHLGVGPGTDPPQERLVGNESIVVLRAAALLDQNVNLLTLELLTKETGNLEDFVECLKLYDKMENGPMMWGELEHILLSLGEKLEREEVDILIKECCDPEDDDG